MSKLLDRLNGKGKKADGPPDAIPQDDPYFQALRVELARLEGQQAVTRALMNILQSRYQLPDGATVNPATGAINLPQVRLPPP